MKYYLNMEPFAGSKKCLIKDENGVEVYRAITVVPLFNKTKTIISDMNENEIIRIEREKTFIPSYTIYINDVFAFNLKQKLVFQKSVYILSNGYRVEGDYRGLNYTLFDENNQPIAKMNKTLFSGKMKSELEVFDDTKKEIALAVAKTVSLPYLPLDD